MSCGRLDVDSDVVVWKHVIRSVTCAHYASIPAVVLSRHSFGSTSLVEHFESPEFSRRVWKAGIKQSLDETACAQAIAHCRYLDMWASILIVLSHTLRPSCVQYGHSKWRSLGCGYRRHKSFTISASLVRLITINVFWVSSLTLSHLRQSTIESRSQSPPCGQKWLLWRYWCWFKLGWSNQVDRCAKRTE